MTTFDYPWIQETVESIHRNPPTTRELMQAGSRSAEVNAKLDKWIDLKVPLAGAYYMPKWFGKIDTEDSVEYDSLGLPLKDIGGYDLNSGRGYDSLGLRRGLDDFGVKYWVEPHRDCLGLVKYVPIWIPDLDSENAIKQAPCGGFVLFNGFPIRYNPTLG